MRLSVTSLVTNSSGEVLLSTTANMGGQLSLGHSELSPGSSWNTTARLSSLVPEESSYLILLIFEDGRSHTQLVWPSMKIRRLWSQVGELAHDSTPCLVEGCNAMTAPHLRLCKRFCLSYFPSVLSCSLGLGHCFGLGGMAIAHVFWSRSFVILVFCEG